jgi:hypothetical protein
LIRHTKKITFRFSPARCSQFLLTGGRLYKKVGEVVVKTLVGDNEAALHFLIEALQVAAQLVQRIHVLFAEEEASSAWWPAAASGWTRF